MTDDFGARYYESNLGRFLSPDSVGGHLENPQTLNLYAYAGNNPANFTDPDGHDFYLACTPAKDNASTCQGGHAGTTDINGNFHPNVVTSASLSAEESGNTATVNENGVQITTRGKTNEGVFINNIPAADFQGSGKLAKRGGRQHLLVVQHHVAGLDVLAVQLEGDVVVG